MTDPRTDQPTDGSAGGPADLGDSGADYDVVLLVERALSPQDAVRLRALHDSLDEPVVYHVLMPLDDAPARVQASLGSLSGSELLANPVSSPMHELDAAAVRDELHEASDRDLAATVAALEGAGATVASHRLVLGAPVDELAAQVAAVDGREAIVLTEPHVVSELFHLDWTSKARRQLGVPVLHLLEHETFDEQAGGPDGISGA